MDTKEITDLGLNDLITIAVSGTMGSGSGRMTKSANTTLNLGAFLETYAPVADSDPGDLTADEMRKLVQEGGPEALAVKLAELVNAVASSESLPARILRGAEAWLTEQGIVMSATDPGDDVFYLNPNDLNVSASTGPGNGTYQWFVTGAASIGLGL